MRLSLPRFREYSASLSVLYAYVCICTYVCKCTCGGQRCQMSRSIALHLTSEGAHQLARLSGQKALPATRILLPLPPVAWDHKHKLPWADFYVGAWDPNLCSHLPSQHFTHRARFPFPSLPSLNSCHRGNVIPLVQGFSSFLFTLFPFPPEFLFK